MPCNNQPCRTEGCIYNSATNCQEVYGWLTRIFGGNHFHQMNNLRLISPIIIYWTIVPYTKPQFCSILNYDTIFRFWEQVFLVGVLISPSISFLLPCFDFDLLLRAGIFSVIFLERAVLPSLCDSSTS